MIAENNEFFRHKNHMFHAKLNEMQGMILSRQYYRPPNMETMSFIVAFIRFLVDSTVKFWRLNRDVENRMRFTRAL